MKSFEQLLQKIEEVDDVEVGVGATEEELRHAEELLGVSIEGQYRSFLKKFGYALFEYVDIYGIEKDIDSQYDLVFNTQSERIEMSPRMPPYLIPFCNDGTGNFYCLDSRSGAEPKVVFWDHELGESQKPRTVSKTFAEWLYKEIS